MEIKERRTKVMKQCADFQEKTGFDDSVCAELLETTRSTWNKWKNGKAKPVGNMVGLALLGVSVLLAKITEEELDGVRAGLDLEGQN